jgi:hypothetical protein
MKPAFRYLIFALLLLAAGASLFAVGQIERRVTNARKQLLTMKYDAPADEYERIERSTSYVRGLPWIAGLGANVREQRATAQYWQADYPSLEREATPGGEATAQNADLLLLAANAAYRSIDFDDGQAVQHLEAVLGQYAEVLKRDPERFDAAYNYQFVARAHDALASTRGGRPGAKAQKSIAAARQPSTQTIHGRRGAPPVGLRMNEFKVIVPQRSDERKEQPEAGKGGAKIRKG